MRGKAKTSVEILSERDALEERARELELALVRVGEQVEHALRHPEIQLVTLRGIREVVRAAVPGPPLSKTRATTGPDTRTGAGQLTISY